jgi:predicted ATP-grasp superfamily ATP-dependent carboligase
VYTGRKIRQLQPDFGVTCFGVSEKLPAISEMTITLLRKIRFRGLVAVEYVEDQATGEIYFVEINARSYYHNALFRDCGVDLSWIAYLDAVRHPLLAREVEPRQTYGRKWLDLTRDARSFSQKRRAGELGWGAWLRSLAQARSFAVFARDDPWPFVDFMAKQAWRQVAKGARRLRDQLRRTTRLTQ